MPKKQTTETGVPVSAPTQPAKRGRARTSKNAVAGASPETGSTITTPATRRKISATVGNSKNASSTLLARRVQNSFPTQDDGFREAVARLAYHFWEVRGRNEGSADEDWVRAETAVRELLEVVPRSSK